MKRLLLLGGSSLFDEIKKYSINRDVELIAIGKDEKTPLKQYVTESYNIDTTDVNSITKLIIEKKIDGVFLGGNEDNISASFDYLEKLNLHYYQQQYLL